ncbi:hypothetical protein OE88DRAFT_1638246 [Heliocybe sulcata]|uniref:Uncharacterized protein n=1 Tax=Heliocybe sulcata TaxID=5364 RepID=A0A5C3MQ10_9AGAM|nr:hypothetical protein OE88DRAFT_1638246 [Heliocybe sulcata]
MNHDVSGAVRSPFWEDFPFCDIHLCITPDVLHQLYQGVFKHIVEWCSSIMDEKELDCRMRCIPPGCGVRIFKNGISTLSQISGSERKNMAKVLLACLVGKLPERTILALRGLLDFIYQAQNKTHDNDTLVYLQDSLNLFHANKDIFVELGVREDFNIPKFHSLLHYVNSIRFFGVTDKYNTEMFERLHIDFAKEGWHSTNRRDEHPQMVSWIEHHEKISFFECYVGWREQARAHSVLRPSVQLANTGPSPPLTTFAIKIAKHPTAPRQALHSIQDQHNAPGFIRELKKYLHSQTGLPQHEGRGIENAILPFNHVDIFYNIKIRPISIDDEEAPWDIIKASPSKGSRGGRFDTVIAIATDDAQSTGLEGIPTLCFHCENLQAYFYRNKNWEVEGDFYSSKNHREWYVSSVAKQSII